MYQHTQRSPLNWLLFLLPFFAFVAAWINRADAALTISVAAAGVAMIVVALSIQTLTVSDGGNHLSIRYGPLNLFGTNIDYREITAFEQGRSSLIDGWGIHFVPFRGWTLNLWGFECVRISRGGKTIRVGTNDSKNLVRFLNERVPKMPTDKSTG